MPNIKDESECKHQWKFFRTKNWGRTDEWDLYLCDECRQWGRLDYNRLLQEGVFPQCLLREEYYEIISQHMEVLHPPIPVFRRLRCFLLTMLEQLKEIEKEDGPQGNCAAYHRGELAALKLVLEFLDRNFSAEL